MNGFKRPELPDISCDVLIIGAGLAGLSLAKHLSDLDIKIYVLGSPYESQLAKGGIIEKSSKLPNGAVGLNFMVKFMEEVQNLGINLKSSLVTEVDFTQTPKLVKTKFQKYYADTVVIATGAKQKRLGFPGEEQYFHNGISDCAVCDGNLFRGRKVAIMGGHKYTVKSAEYLRNIVGDISLLWLDDDIQQNLKDGLAGFPKENIYLGVHSMEVSGSDVIERITFSDREGQHIMEIDALFIEGLPIPNSDIFENDLELAADKSIQVNEEFMTSVENVYALGDVTGVTNGVDEILNQVDSVSEILKNKFK